MEKLLLFLSLVLMTSCGQAQTDETPTLPSGYLYKVDPGIPGKQVFICGEHPFNTNGYLVSAGDLSGQTRQVFDNIKASLATVNMTLSNVTQITYSIKGTAIPVNPDTVSLLKNIGATYFSPVPGIVDVKSIPKIVRDDVLIEVEVIAIK